jgi:hypothetical protein
MKTVYWVDYLGTSDKEAYHLARTLLVRDVIYTGNELVVFYVKQLVAEGILSDVTIINEKEKLSLPINQYGAIVDCPDGFLCAANDAAYWTLKAASKLKRGDK